VKVTKPVNQRGGIAETMQQILSGSDISGPVQAAVKIGQLLKASGCRVTTAESCTGGWIAQSLTAVPGSSEWFDLGLVTYSNEAKQQYLQVSADTLSRFGAVSEATARQMALGALTAGNADFSMISSGIAGPDGGTADKPVGTVWLAWGVRQGSELTCEAQVYHFDGDREAIRRASVHTALAGLIARLERLQGA